MEKRARGEIRVHERRDGQVTYSLRFRVNGKREILTLGTDTDGWTCRKAERKLEDVLARIRAGVLGASRPAGAGTPIEPRHSMCSRPDGGRRAKASSGRGLARTTSGGCASTCCRSSATTRSRRSTSRSSSGYREHKVIERERVAEAIASRRAATGQARTASRSAEQREHQQDARHAHADPRQCRRARPPGVEPGSRKAAPAEGRQASAPAARGRRSQGAARCRRRDGPEPLPRSPDRSAADDRGDGEVRAARHGDVPAPVARRRRPSRAPGDRRGKDRRGQPPRRPES